MKLLLERIKYLEDRTIGRLSIDGVFHFYTLEDTFREIVGVPVEQWKVPGKTAIPMGTYKMVWHDSPRFGKKLPMLVDVPGYKYVLMHAGNYPENTEGCVLVGANYDERGHYITDSRRAVETLLALIGEALDSGNIEIEVK